MSDNDFTTAARAEAERVAGRRRLGGNSVPTSAQRAAFYWEVRLFEEAAVWARDHLAAQEPTDAEVHEVAKVLYARTQGGSLDALDSRGQAPWEDFARAALAAARNARQGN